jgi:hypothetical protein
VNSHSTSSEVTVVILNFVAATGEKQALIKVLVEELQLVSFKSIED